MKKSFVSKRTTQAVAVKDGTTEHLHQCFDRAEKQYGRHSPEGWEARLILAVMYYAAEDYEQVERLLAGYVAAQKGKEGSNPMWMFWTRSLLIEANFNLDRIAEGMRISNEGKSIARNIDISAPDPLLKALLQRAIALEAKGDMESRQRGFVVALLTLSWYVSHGFERSRADAPVTDQLRLFFDSYGIRGDEWEWTVKHSHLTRYDFVGLLSILLHHTGLAPKPLSVVAKRGSVRPTHKATQP